jgi:hypothetical protein
MLNIPYAASSLLGRKEKEGMDEEKRGEEGKEGGREGGRGWREAAERREKRVGRLLGRR